MTRVSKHLLGACLVLGLIFAAGSLTIHSLRFHSYLLSFLRRTTGWDVSIRDSSLKLLRGRITLAGVEVKDPQKTVTFNADLLRFDVSAFSIIRGKLIVTDFDVDRPSLVVVKSGRPMKGIPVDILEKIYAGFERSVFLQNVIVEGATFTHLTLTLLDPTNPGAPVKAGGLEKAVVSIHPSLLGRMEADVVIDRTSGIFPAAERIALTASLGKKEFLVDSFLLDAPKVKVEARATLTGDLVLGNLEADARIQVPTILSDPVEARIEADLKDRRAEVRKIHGSLGGATLDASGEVFFSDLNDIRKIRYDLPFEAKDLPLESIFGKLGSAILGPAKGLGELKGRFQGELPGLEARADAVIHDFRHGAMRSRRVDGTLNFHWPELDFDADIKPGEDGRIQGHAKGGVQFKYLPPFKYIKAAPKTIDVTFENASMEDILPTLKVSGRLNGELHLKEVPGSTSAVGTGHAEVTQARWFLGSVDRFVTDMQFKPGGLILFSKSEYHAPGIEPILWPDTVTMKTGEGLARFSGQPMEGLFVEGVYDTKTDVFKIDRLDYRRNGSDLKGALVLRDGGGTEATLKGTLNLEGLTAVPAFFRDMSGLARVDLTMKGTSQDPDLRGWIEFQDNEVEVRGFPMLENLKGRVAFEGSTIKPDLTGYMGDGRFQLGGSLVHKRFRPERFDLSFSGGNLSYSRPNVYRVDFDANVRLTGTAAAPKLSGRVDIVDALYVKPFRVRDVVLKPFEEEAEPPPWQEVLNPLELDLVVRHSGDLRIKNNIADIYLLADLQVAGTFGRPLIRGAFTAVEGEVRLFGDTFTILDGRLEYIDPARREPYLILTAEEDLPPLYTVTVQIKGYLSNLEVDLSSSPALPREDVISLITTGRTQEELRQAGLSRQTLGVTVLAGEITSVIERPVSKSTGLDVFRLEASESGQLSKVALGKNVTDRLTLEFQNDFAPETAQRSLQANYYLTDNILLKGRRVWESSRTGATTPPYNLNLSFRLRLY